MEEAGLKLVAEGANQFFSDMDKAGGSVDKFTDTTGKGAKGVGDFGKATDGAGSKFAAFGGIVAGGAAIAGAALIGIGAAALDMASQSNQATNDMQASLGLTRDEAEQLTDVARNIFGNNFGADMADVSASLITVRQQMKGLADEDLQAVTEAALALRDVFGFEVSESTNAANVLMEKFGLTSKQAFDFITAGAQQGLNTSGDFLETITEYGVLFADGGATADQFFSTLQTGLQGGVLGTDKAADAFKEFGIRIVDGSDATKGALKELGLSYDDIQRQITSGELTKAEAFQLVTEKLRGVDDIATQTQLGVALIGTQFEDLGNEAALGIDMAATSMADLAGSTDSLNAKYTNLGSVGETLWRQTLLTLEPVGAALLDLANAAMPSILEGFESLRGVLEAVVGPTADFLSALGGNQEAMANLPGVLQGVVGAAQGIPQVFSDAKAGLDAFFNTPLGTEIREGAQVVADYFSGPFQEDLTAGIGVVQGALDTFAASPWAQEIQQGAAVVSSYIVNDWATDFQAGIGVASDALAPFAEEAGRQWDAFTSDAGAVADFMMNDFPSDFQAGMDLVVGFVNGLPGQVQAGWDAMVTGATTAVDGIISAITGAASRAASAGRAFVNSIKDGIIGAFDSLLREARAKFQELADLLPGSEPKDTSSPLYGLGKRGDALIGNFAAGVLASGALTAALAVVTKAGKDELAAFVEEIDRIAGEALGGAVGVRRSGIGAIEQQIGRQEAVDQALSDSEDLTAKITAEQTKGAEHAAAIRDEARARDLKAAQQIAETETAAAKQIDKLRADATALRADAQKLTDPDKRAAAIEKAVDLEARAAEEAADLEARLIDLRATRGVAAAEAEAEARAREVDSLATVLELQDAQTAKNREYQVLLASNARTQDAINAAMLEARELAAIDPVTANRYLELRQQQIAETEEAQRRLDATTNAGLRAQLEAQMALRREAQQLEAAQLAEQIRARGSELGVSGASVAQQVASATSIATSNTAYYGGGNGNTINVNGAGMAAQQLASLLLSILNGQAGQADILARTA